MEDWKVVRVLTDINFRVQVTSFRIVYRKAETNFRFSLSSYTISLEYSRRCQLFLRLSDGLAIT
jgi:hypothetical protein